MPSIIGRQCRIEVGLTYAAAKTVTAVTKAFPAVATSTAHALVQGTVGFFTCPDGMIELDGQAGRVYVPAADTFQVQGLASTSYSTFLSTVANTFTPVATWGLLAESTSLEFGGGDPDQLDDTRLIDAQKRLLPGPLSAQTIKIGVKPQTFNSLTMDTIEQAALSQTGLVFRATYVSDGSVRIWRGVPGLISESVQVGQIGSGSMSIIAQGRVLKGKA